jgi:hypothetical protein
MPHDQNMPCMRQLPDSAHAAGSRDVFTQHTRCSTSVYYISTSSRYHHHHHHHQITKLSHSINAISTSSRYLLVVDMSCRCRVNKQESHSTPDTIGDPVWLCRGAATQKNTALRACSKEVHPRGRVTLPCFLLGRCCLYTIAHISPPYGMHACMQEKAYY